MNAQERKVFWETLCSLPGDNIEQETNKLISTIKLPKYLFRYRSVSLSSLEALRTNMLHFSSANYYDDPFDTFLHIDVDAIRQEFLSAFKTRESTETVVEEVKKLLKDLLTEERKAFFTADNITNALSNGLTESFIGSALALRDEVKKDAWSVCFSENGFNEALWLKYADQHKGFVRRMCCTCLTLHPVGVSRLRERRRSGSFRNKINTQRSKKMNMQDPATH